MLRRLNLQSSLVVQGRIFLTNNVLKKKVCANSIFWKISIKLRLPAVEVNGRKSILDRAAISAQISIIISFFFCWGQLILSSCPAHFNTETLKIAKFAPAEFLRVFRFACLFGCSFMFHWKKQERDWATKKRGSCRETTLNLKILSPATSTFTELLTRCTTLVYDLISTRLPAE